MIHRFFLLIPVCCLLLTGCASVKPGVYGAKAPDESFAKIKGMKPGEMFTSELDTSAKQFAKPGEIKQAGAKIDNEYRLGPGDVFSFLVRGREDISREEILVSPDGDVSLPRVGIFKVGGRTLKELTDEFVKYLTAYYDKPEVTLIMKRFANNRVFVLGRVANPGAVNFQGKGTLLEALSLAGGLPTDQTKSFLSRCMIVRSNEMVMWIDLKELLERGNMGLNARLQNGDVIFIPQSEDQLAYVLGEVRTPGVVALRSEMTLLDVLMSAGGPTKDANVRDVFLIRTSEGKGAVQKINLSAIASKGDFRTNYSLRDGDMIYVPQTGISKFSYFCSQLQPFFSIIGMVTSSAASLGFLDNLNALMYSNGAYNSNSSGGGSGSGSGSSSSSGP